MAALDQRRKHLQFELAGLLAGQLTGGLQCTSGPGDSCCPEAGGVRRITGWRPLRSEIGTKPAKVHLGLLAKQRLHAFFHRIVGHDPILALKSGTARRATAGRCGQLAASSNNSSSLSPWGRCSPVAGPTGRPSLSSTSSVWVS